MNEDRIKGNWKQFTGKIREQWGKLTDDDLDVIPGKREQFLGKLQERQGLDRDAAEKQLTDWQKRNPAIRSSTASVPEGTHQWPAAAGTKGRFSTNTRSSIMQTPQRFRHMLSAVALGLMASGAMAMTNAEHTAAKNLIEADYKAAKEQC